MSLQSAFGAISGYDEVRERTADPNDESIQGGIGRAFCDVRASNPGASDWALSASTGGTSNLAIGPIADNFCKPYWDNAGIDEPGEGLPFEGGQCSALYRIRTVRSNLPPGSVSTPSLLVFGPIQSITYSPNPVQIPASGSAQQVTLTVVGANGTVQDVSRVAGSPEESIDLSPFIRLESGAPDNCGDPPPVPVPGPNNPGVDFGEPITKIVGGSPVNITVGPVSIDLSGKPVFNISTELGDVVFSPTIEPPALPQPSPPPPVDGTPVEPEQPQGEVDEPPASEEDEFETIGYRWQIYNIPSGWSGIPGTSPRVFPTVQGSLALRLRNEGGLTFYSDYARLLSEEGSLVRSDASLKVIGATYNILPELRLRLTPVRARVKL